MRFASYDMGGAPADVGPFASAFWRVSLCLPLLYAWMRIEEKRSPADAPKVRFSRRASGGIVFAGDLFWHLAILKTTVANATFFATMAPLFVVLDRLARVQAAGVTRHLHGPRLCLLGGAALIGQSLQADPARSKAISTALPRPSSSAWLLGRKQSAQETAGAARVTFEAGLITSAILLVIALLFDTRVIPQTAARHRSASRYVLCQPCRRPGLLAIALGRLPADLLVSRDFPRGHCGGCVRLGDPGRGADAGQSLGGASILFGIWIARPKADGRQDEALPPSYGERPHRSRLICRRAAWPAKSAAFLP